VRFSLSVILLESLVVRINSIAEVILLRLCGIVQILKNTTPRSKLHRLSLVGGTQGTTETCPEPLREIAAPFIWGDRIHLQAGQVFLSRVTLRETPSWRSG